MQDEVKHRNELKAPEMVMSYLHEPVMMPHIAYQYQVPKQNFLTAEAQTVRVFTPPDLRELYRIPQADPNAPPRDVCIVSFAGGVFGNVDPITNVLTGGDFQNYWTKYCNRITFPTVQVITVNGARNNPQYNDSSTNENCVDCEMIGAFVPPSTTIKLVIGTSFLNVLQAVKAMNPKPFIVSCSWGFREKGSPLSYVQSVDAALQELVSSGINFCCSAGDSGAFDGGTSVNVDFPSSSPWSTGCGGTRLVSSTDSYVVGDTQETVWNINPTQSATGGGVSELFDQPSYQQKVIKSTKRCVPDVAGVADPTTGCKFLVGGQEVTVGGTSIVAPMISAFLLNSGIDTFVNPLLYQCPSGCFHDVTQGDNGGPFSAGPGYDMCTGLGSIDGTLLSQSLQNLMPSKPVPPSTALITPTSLSFHGPNPLPQQLYFQEASAGPKRQKRDDSQWKSSDPRIATVDANTGLVTAVSDGTCSVSYMPATPQIVFVSVTNMTSTTSPVTSLFVLPCVPVGSTITLSPAIIQPQGALARITWSFQTESMNTFAAITPSNDTMSVSLRGIAPGIVTLVAQVSGSKVSSQCSLQISN